MCAATIPAHAGQRIDCVVEGGWSLQPNHTVSVIGAPVAWTLEYLELATQHGHTTGLLQGFVLPAASRQFRGPMSCWSASSGYALALLLLLEPLGFESRAARSVNLLLVAGVAALATLILALAGRLALSRRRLARDVCRNGPAFNAVAGHGQPSGAPPR